MARKVTYEQALVAHGWVAFDPADTDVIEKLFKKTYVRDCSCGRTNLTLSLLDSIIAGRGRENPHRAHFSQVFQNRIDFPVH